MTTPLRTAETAIVTAFPDARVSVSGPDMGLSYTATVTLPDGRRHAVRLVPSSPYVAITALRQFFERAEA